MIKIQKPKNTNTKEVVDRLRYVLKELGCFFKFRELNEDLLFEAEEIICKARVDAMRTK